MFYEDARRYTGPRLWWLRLRHVVASRANSVLHRVRGPMVGEFCHLCWYDDDLFLERLVRDPQYERHLEATGRLVPGVTAEHS